MAVLDRIFSKRRKSRQLDSVNGESTPSSPVVQSPSTVKGNAKSGYTPTKSPTEAHFKYPDPPNHGEKRADISESLHSLSNLVGHIMRPLPTQSGDGTYIAQEEGTSMLSDLRSLGFKDYKTLEEFLSVAARKADVDDKTMLMERVIQLVAKMPDKSPRRTFLTNKFVDQLFTSLQHPPLSYLGDKFKYRQADGSYNNIMYPHIGAANTPYARTVAPETIQPGALPDPGLVFDTLFAREKFESHPNKNSSMEIPSSSRTDADYIVHRHYL
jgi:linoleate 10R-lipoxygenase